MSVPLHNEHRTSSTSLTKPTEMGSEPGSLLDVTDTAVRHPFNFEPLSCHSLLLLLLSHTPHAIAASLQKRFSVYRCA